MAFTFTNIFKTLPRAPLPLESNVYEQGINDIIETIYIIYIIHLKYIYVPALTTPNPCLPIPCQHGGVCRPVGFSEYVCECGQENGVTYRGKNCNTAVTLCDSSPCTLGHCVPMANSYRYKVLENVSSFLFLTRMI